MVVRNVSNTQPPLVRLRYLGMARICPDDRSQLEVRTIHGIEVDICPNCGGIWLDRGEINRLRKLSTNEVKDFETVPIHTGDSRPSSGACPACSKSLHPFRYANGHATLSTCEGLCGLWLPEQELDKIAAMSTPPPEALLAAGMHGALSAEREMHLRRAHGVLVEMNRQYGWPAFWANPFTRF